MREEIGGHLTRAQELLRVSADLLEHGFKADSISRSYYAMFHAATATLLLVGVERGSHKALISAFGEFVVKKGFMEARYHGYLRNAFEARSQSDYLPSPSETAEDANVILEQAEEFVGACGKYIEKGELRS
jgi:hypothetical protein